MKCYECGAEVKTKFYITPFLSHAGKCPKCGEAIDLMDYDRLYPRLSKLKFYVYMFTVFLASGFHVYFLDDFADEILAPIFGRFATFSELIIYLIVYLILFLVIVPLIFSPIYSRMINNYFDCKDFWGRKETSEK